MGGVFFDTTSDDGDISKKDMSGGTVMSTVTTRSEIWTGLWQTRLQPQVKWNKYGLAKGGPKGASALLASRWN